MDCRLAFSKFGEVNWCEALGTVLANDEVVNGVSERGGHPVEKKKMRQWYLRITSYADRLLEGLETVDFSDSMKEMQRNWIGKSTGAEISFQIKKGKSENEVSQLAAQNSQLVVYTTRPDTIFGVDFMVVAPEHELVAEITTAEQKEEIEKYLHYVKSRSDRERQADIKQITGCFTGAYAINPFDGRQIPIWIAEYVLAGYGTGAIMAVPCGDQRDYAFAKHFNIPITNIIGEHYNGEEANATKEATLSNSGFLNGMLMKDAIDVAVNKIEELGIGKRKVNYKMRDAGFSRQRYWGEPFPIKWIDGIAYPLDEIELPLELPHVDKYGPGPDGQGPLANIEDWMLQPVKLSASSESGNPPAGGRGAGSLESSTMPGYAGSSWYFLRYMDPKNDKAFCDRKVSDYWNQVDLYIGGTEHAVGHLLYSRMWTKVLYDLNLIGYDAPYKKLVNQGMITGKSYFSDYATYSTKGNSQLYQIYMSSDTLVNADNKFNLDGIDFLKENISLEGRTRMKNVHSYIDTTGRLTESQHKLYIEKFYPNWKESNKILWSSGLTEQGERYIQLEEVIEKMSKSKFNVDNPDDIVQKYGADTFRMYEMFLGPVEMSKPWDTKGIEGVHRFLKKFWRLFFRETKAPPAELPKHSEGKERSSGEAFIVTDDEPTPAELKVLHNTIKKIEQDTERFSFNTGVSGFMIATNELTDLKCHKRKILEPLLILLAPYAPHIAEELYAQLCNSPSPNGEGRGEVSILNASYPTFEEKYVKESSKAYPVAINGKTRTELTIALNANQQQVEALVMENEIVQKWLEGKPPKKIIYVKNKMINVVI